MIPDSSHRGIDLDVRHQLRHFELDVSATLSGGITGVIGRSGAGKSTLLSCIGGLVKPTEGRIVINGETVFDSATSTNVPTDRRRAVLVHQHGYLFPHMTVRSNMRYGYREGEDNTSIESIADSLGITALLDRYPSSLSGGQRQRVAIARAIAANPAVLLLDEPVASLDLKSRNEVVMYLRDVHDRYQIPMVFVSHALSDVLALAEETLTIADGRISSSGPTRGQVMQMATSSGTDAEQIDNVLFGRIVSDREVRVGDVVLHTPHMSSPVGNRVAASVRASEIILAIGTPSASSARNTLNGRVVALTELADTVMATVDVGIELTVELTRHSSEDLELKVGAHVYLVFKASSVVVSPS